MHIGKGHGSQALAVAASELPWVFIKQTPGLAYLRVPDLVSLKSEFGEKKEKERRKEGKKEGSKVKLGG